MDNSVTPSSTSGVTAITGTTASSYQYSANEEDVSTESPWIVNGRDLVPGLANFRQSLTAYNNFEAVTVVGRMAVNGVYYYDEVDIHQQRTVDINIRYTPATEGENNFVQRYIEESEGQEEPNSFDTDNRQDYEMYRNAIHCMNLYYGNTDSAFDCLRCTYSTLPV